MSEHPFLDASFPPPPAARPKNVWDRPPVKPAPGRRHDWRINVLLFLATTASVFATGAGVSSWSAFFHTPPSELFHAGWTFAVPLLAILLCHEFGHYIAARIHHVDASLPYFIPFPGNPFGTMGAVIAMKGRIKSRDALLDIGASGPLAGLVVAIPVLLVGLSLSTVGKNPSEHYMQEGQSLFYMLAKRLVLGPIPHGYDVQLHPTAFAGWAGLFVTMLNLLPWGQLDGGHVAYALFGDRQHRYARFVRAALIPLFLYNLATFALPTLRGESDLPLLAAFFNSLFWLIWFVVTGVIGKVSGGADHPSTEDEALSPVRRAVAWGTLVLFVLLFMPTPLSVF